ncbi:MAG: hypothetical protein KDE19_21165 [Caldilineaceae bacterium]|nr:hypothetical protein [Caldilineaceae bacterium]
MLQNRVVSSPLSSAAPPDLAGSFERALTNERLQVIKRTFSLPDSLQSFLIFSLLLVLLCGALFAHLLLSTTIHQGELQLVELQRMNEQIVRESTMLIEQIAEESSLQQGMERVVAQGYTVAYDRRYIAQPNHMPLHDPQPEIVQGHSSLDNESSLGNQAALFAATQNPGQ